MITVFELQRYGGTPVGRGKVDAAGQVHIHWLGKRPPDHPARYTSVASVYRAYCGGHGPNYRWRTVEYVP